MSRKIFVTRSSMPPFEEYVEMIRPLWDSHMLTNMGELHTKLEEELKDYLNVPYISLFTNGHLAIELSLQALLSPKAGEGQQGEIITTPFTFASTTHAIVRNGFTPVFCDIRMDDYTMDTSLLESLITERTVAILPVHVYGNVCNVEEIERIAEKHHLKVLYDAAHAFSVTYKGESVLKYGDASALSFHATKVFNTVEGGAVVYKDSATGDKLYRLKNFGIMSEEVIDDVGANAKMDEFRAAMGLCNLRYLEEQISLRRAVYERYMEGLSGLSGLVLPTTQPYVQKNYAYFPIRIEKEKAGFTRDDVYAALLKEDIVARKYFYPLTCDFDCYKEACRDLALLNAREAAASVLTLPLYADLAPSDADRIINVIKGLFK